MYSYANAYVFIHSLIQEFKMLVDNSNLEELVDGNDGNQNVDKDDDRGFHTEVDVGLFNKEL